MSASPGTWILVSTVLLVPVASVAGVLLWARRLGEARKVPPLAVWAAYALAIAGALFVALGFVVGVRVAFGSVSGVAIEPSQKARALAEGISEAMNCGAMGFLFAVVTALWLGFCAWKWRGAREQS